jgi:hypothetical protein
VTDLVLPATVKLPRLVPCHHSKLKLGTEVKRVDLLGISRVYKVELFLLTWANTFKGI